MTVAGPLRRLQGAAGDLVLVGAWGAVAALVGLLLRALEVAPTTAGGWDAVAAATLVVPVALTHAVLEARPAGATPGKRWSGLRVVAVDGGGPSRMATVVRAAVKFAPWQLGHSAVFRLVEGAESPVWLVMAIAAQVLALGSFGVLAIRGDRRAVHDLVAGTTVVRTRPAAASESGRAGATT